MPRMGLGLSPHQEVPGLSGGADDEDTLRPGEDSLCITQASHILPPSAEVWGVL